MLLITAKYSPAFAALVLKKSMELLRRQFIAGNGVKEILVTILRHRTTRSMVNLDILGEEVLGENDAGRFLDAYYGLLREVTPMLRGNELCISMKPSAFYSQAHPLAASRSAKIIAEKLSPYANKIHLLGGHIYLDSEEYALSRIYWKTFELLYGKFGNTVRPVLQTYLRYSPAFLDRLIQINTPDSPIHLRLVRGAYWDHECFTAQEAGWDYPSSKNEMPVFTEKLETDRNYRELFMRAWTKGIIAVPATHNIEDIIWIARVANDKKWRIPEFQVLHGMGEGIAKHLLTREYAVRCYLPVLYPKGSLEDALGYLVRRILENKSQFSFVAKHAGGEFQKALTRLDHIQKPFKEEVLC